MIYLAIFLIITGLVTYVINVRNTQVIIKNMKEQRIQDFDWIKITKIISAPFIGIGILLLIISFFIN
jgi:hypothetical protein